MPEKDEPVWIDEQVEEIVLPIKQWLEKTIRSEDKHSTSQPQKQINLRQAIRIALKEYPGTVLSAGEKQDGYHVKILSKSGVLKILRIPFPTITEDSKLEVIPTESSK